MDTSRSKVTGKKIEVFCCYAREDKSFLLELLAHLAALQREGLITIRADIDIAAGMEWEKEITRHLNTAHIILLLISSDFMASDYCYSMEMQRAIERHERDEARVIPIILRPCHWQGAPFSHLQPLPTGGVPIVNRQWHSRDEEWVDVVTGIRKVLKELETVSTFDSTLKETGKQVTVLPEATQIPHSQTGKELRPPEQDIQLVLQQPSSWEWPVKSNEDGIHHYSAEEKDKDQDNEEYNSQLGYTKEPHAEQSMSDIEYDIYQLLSQAFIRLDTTDQLLMQLVNALKCEQILPPMLHSCPQSCTAQPLASGETAPGAEWCAREV